MRDDHRPDGSALPPLVGMLSIVAWSYLLLGLLASLAVAALLSREQTCETIGSNSYCLDDGFNSARFAFALAAGILLSLVGTTMLLAFRQMLVYLHDIRGAVGDSVDERNRPQAKDN